MKNTYLINGMGCAHCKNSIETVLNQTTGVNYASVSLENSSVTIEFDTSKITFNQLQQLVDEIGYELTATIIS